MAVGMVSGTGSLASGGVLALALAGLEPNRDFMRATIETLLLMFVGFFLMVGVVRLPEFGKGRVKVKSCSTLATAMQVGVFGLLIVPELMERFGVFSLNFVTVGLTGLAIVSAWVTGQVSSGILYGRLRASLKR